MKLKLRKVVLALVMLLLGISLNLVFAEEKKYLIPGDARKGWRVFTEKGCIQCHGIGEKGRVLMAPDLARSPTVHRSASGLAAQLWNHAPEMWEKMTAKWIKFHRITEQEMADLFAFLYFIRYLDEPGNALRGKEVLKAKGCTECHSIGERKGTIGPDLAVWKELTNPIIWAQMMWNHAPKMKAVMEKVGIKWPKLEKSDIADILAYLKSLKPTKVEVTLSPGIPEEGKKIFIQKGCARCHAIDEKSPTKGPNLGAGRRDFPPTIGQFAGLMWNHFPEMAKEMAKENIPIPELTSKDMANITAYLFSIRYFDPVGNWAEGKKLFQEKQCVTCHDMGKTATKKEGPSLAMLRGSTSPISLATALWNHGPQMIGKMREMGVKWQKLTDRELVNMMEYFNRGD